MNRTVGPSETSKHNEIDLERFRLKNFLDSLTGSEELEIIDTPIDLADVAAVLDGNPRAVLFTQVGPERVPLAGNVAAGRNRLAKAFGVGPEQLLQELLARLRNKPEIVEIDRAGAPVQQVVLLGEDADLTKIPVHLQHGLDGAPYISASVDYVVDASTGLFNVGMRRLMLRSRKEAGVDLVGPSDLRAIYLASCERGEKLPVSFVVGQHPIDHVAATLRLPVDELGLAASLRGAPMPVVRCVTNDLLVPADAEWVLEGYFDSRGHVEPEGPYGEFLGYYGAVKKNPVFHLTAITRRRDAVFQTSTISGKTVAYTDTAQLCALRAEAVVWKALETAVREPVAVYITPSSGGVFNARVAIRQRVPGEARNAIAATFGCHGNVKNVFVVDPDIDVYSDAQIDWALATRFQADRDIVVASGFRTPPLDPSLNPGSRIGAKAGFDLTRPLDSLNRTEALVPEPPSYTGRRFQSVRAALEDGPKFFSELMAAVGSRDGREIVVELDSIRRDVGLSREDSGRYVLGAASA
jgi:2,5-furandicarboxylate decarboxylase 1